VTRPAIWCASTSRPPRGRDVGQPGPFTQIETGHAAQNILLQAAALDLAAIPVGSLNPAHADVVLALPPTRPSCT